MRLFGKSLGQYVAFQRGLLLVILVVGLARLGLSLVGAPNGVVRWLSLTALVIVGLLYASVAVPIRQFGGYRELLVLIAMQHLLAHGIAAVGIILGMVSGTDNIFTAPEFTSPTVAASDGNGRTWQHLVGGHLVLAPAVFITVFWLVGSAIMFVTRQVSKRRDAVQTRGPAAY